MMAVIRCRANRSQSSSLCVQTANSIVMGYQDCGSYTPPVSEAFGALVHTYNQITTFPGRKCSPTLQSPIPPFSNPQSLRAPIPPCLRTHPKVRLEKERACPPYAPPLHVSVPCVFLSSTSCTELLVCGSGLMDHTERPGTPPAESHTTRG
jgi:hypothetical protein